MSRTKENPALTLLALSAGLIVLSLATRWQGAVYAALAVGLTGVFSPALARRIHYWWGKLASGLGWVASNILLTAVFFLLLTPLAWLSRRFGPKDPLQLKNRSDSLFKDRADTPDKSSFEKPW